MLTIISSVNRAIVSHHGCFVVMVKTLKIFSYHNFQVLQFSIAGYTRQVVHYIPGTLSFNDVLTVVVSGLACLITVYPGGTLSCSTGDCSCGGARGDIQGLTHAKQALYHRATSPDPENYPSYNSVFFPTPLHSSNPTNSASAFSYCH